MKNADMKAIAILLSIALVFTLFTTNIAMIGSVAAVAISSFMSPTGDGGTGDGTGDSTGNNDSYVSNNNNNVSNNGNTNNGNTNNGNTNNSNTNNGNTNNSGNGGAQQNGDANSNDPVIKDPYAFYSKAANDIHVNGTAGYKKVGWQAVEGELTLDKLQFLAGPLTDLIADFMTPKEEAGVNDCPKGSDDAKNRMPASNCSQQYIKSATATKDGDNYIVKIVLTEFTNPSYSDPDGLQLMSREFLDFKDVLNEVATNDTVKALVKSLDGTIVYKDYTITATMTADGKFIKIVHYGVGDINADVQAVAGSLKASGALSFNAEYYDFVY